MIWSVIWCEMYYPYQNISIKRGSGILFFISIDLHCTMWNSMSGYPRKDLRRINMWLRTRHGQECNWETFNQTILFIRYWHWCHWQKTYQRSMLPTLLHLSPITKMIWTRLLIIWRVSNSRVIPGIKLYISVLQYWLKLNTLIFPGNSSLATLVTSISYLRILLIKISSLEN